MDQNQSSADQKVEEVQEIETGNPENDSKTDSPDKQKLMVDEYHTVMVPDPIKGPVVLALCGGSDHILDLLAAN